jgi:hypothetical protein
MEIMVMDILVLNLLCYYNNGRLFFGNEWGKEIRLDSGCERMMVMF